MIIANSRFAVYALFKFFVEYNNEENKTIGLKSFLTGEIMDKYVQFKICNK
ncbi:hypothetical protein IIF7_18367 [Zunongwangia atlantica 22II14-10F7]|uniref:Uncharacterized protein n=1 Tax=Zunongwangia atlantica 22II14-10F7 TaxID=1185767 RepID=A0A1Y1SYX8_9FLAO|nr:hypothetical protein IIF7_18367 [Zunongwangia atlantica 22II14-10F7]